MDEIRPTALIRQPTYQEEYAADLESIFDAWTRYSNHLEPPSVLFRSPLTYLYSQLEPGGAENDLQTAIRRHDLDTARALIQEGSYVNSEHPRPLLLAVNEGLLEVVNMLLVSAVHAAATTSNDRMAALLLASRRGHVEIIAIFFQSRSFMLADKAAALFEAVEYGHINAVNHLVSSDGRLLSYRHANGQVAMHRAVLAKNEPMVRHLLSLRATFRSPGAIWTSPLHFAIAEGDSSLVEILITHGADVDSLDGFGGTALGLAVKYGHDAVVRTLMRRRARIDQQFLGGITALHAAVMFDNLEVLKLLISRGANVNIRTNSGETPLLKAVDNATAQLAQELIAGGADVNAKDRSGRSCVHYAAEAGNDALVSYLIERPGLYYDTDLTGSTALALAVQHRHVESARLIVREWIAYIRRDQAVAGQHVSPGDCELSQLFQEDVEAAFHIAVELDDYGLVAMLLDEGPGFDHSKLIEFLHVAVASRHRVIVPALISHGADAYEIGAYGMSAVDWAKGDALTFRNVASGAQSSSDPDDGPENAERLCTKDTIEVIDHCLETVSDQPAALGSTLFTLGLCMIILKELHLASTLLHWASRVSPGGYSWAPVLDCFLCRAPTSSSYCCSNCKLVMVCEACIDGYANISDDERGCLGHVMLRMPAPSSMGCMGGLDDEATLTGLLEFLQSCRRHLTGCDETALPGQNAATRVLQTPSSSVIVADESHDESPLGLRNCELDDETLSSRIAPSEKSEPTASPEARPPAVSMDCHVSLVRSPTTYSAQVGKGAAHILATIKPCLAQIADFFAGASLWSVVAFEESVRLLTHFCRLFRTQQPCQQLLKSGLGCVAWKGLPPYRYAQKPTKTDALRQVSSKRLQDEALVVAVMMSQCLTFEPDFQLCCWYSWALHKWTVWHQTRDTQALRSMLTATRVLTEAINDHPLCATQVTRLLGLAWGFAVVCNVGPGEQELSEAQRMFAANILDAAIDTFDSSSPKEDKEVFMGLNAFTLYAADPEVEVAHHLKQAIPSLLHCSDHESAELPEVEFVLKHLRKRWESRAEFTFQSPWDRHLCVRDGRTLLRFLHKRDRLIPAQHQDIRDDIALTAVQVFGESAAQQDLMPARASLSYLQEGSAAELNCKFHFALALGNFSRQSKDVNIAHEADEVLEWCVCTVFYNTATRREGFEMPDWGTQCFLHLRKNLIMPPRREPMPEKLNAEKLFNLSAIVMRQFHDTAPNSHDLRMAEHYAQRAFNIVKRTDSMWQLVLGNMSHVHMSKFSRTRERKELDRAIQIKRLQIRTLPRLEPQRVQRLLELQKLLKSRYLVFHELSDVESAIRLGNKALTPANVAYMSPMAYANALLGHSSVLQLRYRDRGAERDLRAVTSLVQSAIEVPGCSTNTDVLKRLVGIREMNFVLQQTDSNLDALINGTQSFLEIASLGIPERVSHLSSLLLALHYAERSEETAAVLDELLELVPRLRIESLSPDDARHALRNIENVADLVACTCIESGRNAIVAAQSLEVMTAFAIRWKVYDRAFLYAQPDETRRAIDNEYLMSQADWPRPANDDGLMQATFTLSEEEARRLRAGGQAYREEILAGLRTQLDQARAAQARLYAPFSEDELIELANSGPIVAFSVGFQTSVAILVTSTGVRHLKLSMLRHENVSEVADSLMREAAGSHDSDRDTALWNQQFKEILFWLWQAAVKPVLQELGYTHKCRPGTKKPTVWWLANGLMGNMPLHATGEYMPRSTKCTMDYVVSCYTPSFSCLRYSRHRQRELSRNRSSSAVAIAMSDLEGAQRLTGVSKELDAFQRCFQGAHVVHEPTKEDAITQVLSNNIVHFACHGALHATKPEEAALLVNNDVADGLTVSDLDKLVCSRGRLAYLSACSTAANPSRESLSEAVHLTTGFQLAGFPHVVGTLWQTDDDAAVNIAELFYTSLTARSAPVAAGDEDSSDAGTTVNMDGDTVAAALDEAITRFRSKDGISAANFIAWGPFVYFGS